AGGWRRCARGQPGASWSLSGSFYGSHLGKGFAHSLLGGVRARRSSHHPASDRSPGRELVLVRFAMPRIGFVLGVDLCPVASEFERLVAGTALVAHCPYVAP